MIACPQVVTGQGFLAGTLSHLDCQAQTLGSFGFQQLAAPGSPASLALTGLLTLFIALFAIRLLFGSEVGSRDAVTGLLKIGIVLTLAASWPAVRILAYDTVLLAPAEIAANITPSSLPDTGTGFAARLQNIDDGIASLTASGTGRQTGSLELEARPQGAFRAIALEDETALGWGRTIYLATAIGSLAVVRIAGGLLLALTPLFAGLLLFDLSRGLFAGWLRGLVLAALGSLGVTLLLAIEVALMEPWLSGVLNRLSLGYATPSAPTELLALSLAFAIASAGLFYLLAKVAFQNSWRTVQQVREGEPSANAWAPRFARAEPALVNAPHSRALMISSGVQNVIRHEEARSSLVRSVVVRGGDGSVPSADGPRTTPLGSSWSRTAQRTTAAQTSRDNRP